jgi:methyltransferase-like protein
MTTEEIERILQTVAENQAKHDEEFAMLLKSQNRYDERLATISDIMHDLADKQLKNEESRLETNRRFAELAAAQVRYEARQE